MRQNNAVEAARAADAGPALSAGTKAAVLLRMRLASFERKKMLPLDDRRRDLALQLQYT